jgi:methyl-accepting chemotaxis protein
MQKKKYRRKQYIIYPAFQLKISAVILGTLLLATIITAGFLYLNILNSVLPEFSADRIKEKMEIVNQIKQRQEAQYIRVEEDRRLFDFLFPETAEMLADYEKGVVIGVLHQVNRNLIPWMLILVAFVLAAGIFLTHRIAGPVYNFKKSIGRMREGDLTKRIHLRWSDEFKDLAQEINNCISTIDKSTSKYKDLTSKIEKLNKDLESVFQAGTQDSNQIQRLLSDTRESIRQLEERLNYYKTS